MATVLFRTLSCQRTEDNTGADEAYLTYNGERIFGPTRINDGQSRNINVFRRLNGQGSVSLHDEDSPDPDDFLGSWTVSQTEADQGDRVATFSRDGARYTMIYSVLSIDI